MTKAAINWLVFVSSLYYCAWASVTMFGALFVLGDNDTMLETVGILAIGITAIPGSLLALRYRRLAAVILAFAAVLWIIGVLDGNAYLAKKYGTQIMFRDQIRSLLKVTGAPLFLAVFTW